MRSRAAGRSSASRPRSSLTASRQARASPWARRPRPPCAPRARTPATVGILDGVLVVGLSEAELRRFGEAGAAARKVGARDLAACCVQGALGATTVGGTLAAVRPLGIEVMATGGLGGVHREFPSPPDISVRPGRARPHARRDRLLRREVAARRARPPASCWRRSGFRCSDTAPTRCRSSTPQPAGPPVSARVESAARGRGRGARALAARLERAQSRWRDRPSRASTTSSR